MVGTAGYQGAAIGARRSYLASGELVPTDVVALTRGHPSPKEIL